MGPAAPESCSAPPAQDFCLLTAAGWHHQALCYTPSDACSRVHIHVGFCARTQADVGMHVHENALGCVGGVMWIGVTWNAHGVCVRGVWACSRTHTRELQVCV